MNSRISVLVAAGMWVAAGAAWAFVALRAWNQTRKTEARKRTFNVSDRLLQQVFPNDIRP